MNWRVLAGQTFVQVVADITDRGGNNFLRNIMICPVHVKRNAVKWNGHAVFANEQWLLTVGIFSLLMQILCLLW